MQFRTIRARVDGSLAAPLRLLEPTYVDADLLLPSGELILAGATIRGALPAGTRLLYPPGRGGLGQFEEAALQAALAAAGTTFDDQDGQGAGGFMETVSSLFAGLFGGLERIELDGGGEVDSRRMAERAAYLEEASAAIGSAWSVLAGAVHRIDNVILAKALQELYPLSQTPGAVSGRAQGFTVAFQAFNAVAQRFARGEIDQLDFLRGIRSALHVEAFPGAETLGSWILGSGHGTWPVSKNPTLVRLLREATAVLFAEGQAPTSAGAVVHAGGAGPGLALLAALGVGAYWLLG